METTLPHNPEAEASLVSNCLQHADLLDDAIDKSIARWILDEDLVAILQLGMEMRSTNVPIDVVTIGTKLMANPEHAPLLPKAAEILNKSATRAHHQHYEKIVKADWTRRECYRALHDSMEIALNLELDPDSAIDAIESKVLDVRDVCSGRTSEIVSAKEALMLTIDAIEKAQARGGGLAGHSTGMTRLDSMLSGWQPGCVTIIAARPSQGKSALLVGMLSHLLDKDVPCALFSLEMPTDQIMRRLLGSRCNIPYVKMLEGGLSSNEISRIMHAAAEIASKKFLIDDTPALSLDQFRSRCRRLSRAKIEVVGVDYIQLMRSYSKRAKENRQVEVSDVSNGILAAMKECKMAGIILAQMNRDTDKVARKPRLSDLRESGSIEQDAHTVAFIHRPNKEDEEYETLEPCTLEVMKNRNGPTGTIAMNFHKSSMLFTESVPTITRT